MNTNVATTVANSTIDDSGSSRRARLAQNRPSRIPWAPVALRTRCEVIRKPEITKKTSTPTKPPLIRFGHRW